MPDAKTYDQQCADLAAVFLSDEPHLDDPGRIDRLATLIQQTIEDFIETENDNYEPREGKEGPWSGGFAPNH